jgi:hypothetical protein
MVMRNETAAYRSEGHKTPTKCFEKPNWWIFANFKTKLKIKKKNTPTPFCNSNSFHQELVEFSNFCVADCVDNLILWMLSMRYQSNCIPKFCPYEAYNAKLLWTLLWSPYKKVDKPGWGLQWEGVWGRGQYPLVGYRN